MDLTALRDAIEGASGHRPDGSPRPIGGGCINETFQLGEFFVKVNSPSGLAMFEAEQEGLAELHHTGTIRVPQPVCAGATPTHSFLVLEFLPLGPATPNSQQELGRQLAALHRVSCPQFGWDRDNFIGATPQPNPRTGSWIEFLRDQRLEAILQRAQGRGFKFRQAARLLDRLESFFPSGEPSPSLLHGDLWGGNAGTLTDGSPVVFDPAVYFGDREADLAMTTLFGGFSAAFYAAYQEAWPLPAGHQPRVELYNLYHVLNHAVLFGGSYVRQAQGMIDQLVGQI